MGTLFTQPKKAVNPLQELSQTLAALQIWQKESQQIQKTATDELVPLLAAQRKNEMERPCLVRARQAAHYAAQEARDTLARHIGRPEENSDIEQLQEAEQALQAASDALRACDAAFDRESVHKRILALREQLQAEEQRYRELTRTVEKIREERKSTALIDLYTTLQHIYEVLEHGGPAIAAMRNDDPEAYDQLFRDICIDRWEMADLLIQRFNLHEDDYRPELKIRQQSARDQLAKLAKLKK